MWEAHGTSHAQREGQTTADADWGLLSGTQSLGTGNQTRGGDWGLGREGGGTRTLSSYTPACDKQHEGRETERERRALDWAVGYQGVRMLPRVYLLRQWQHNGGCSCLCLARSAPSATNQRASATDRSENPPYLFVHSWKATRRHRD